MPASLFITLYHVAINAYKNQVYFGRGACATPKIYYGSGLRFLIQHHLSQLQDAVVAIREFHVALLTEYPVSYSWNIKNRAFYRGACYLCEGIYGNPKWVVNRTSEGVPFTTYSSSEIKVQKLNRIAISLDPINCVKRVVSHINGEPGWG